MKSLLVFLSITIIAMGCVAHSYYRPSNKNLEVSGTSRFKDLPIPSGFTQVPLNSFVFESKVLRTARLEYHGVASPYSVVSFYKTSMPKHNWKILNVIEGRETILNFEKDQELCMVEFMYRRGKSILIISISPISSESDSQMTHLKE